MSFFKRAGRAIGSIARVAAPVAAVIPGVGLGVSAALLAAGQLGKTHALKAGSAPAIDLGVGPAMAASPTFGARPMSMTSSMAAGPIFGPLASGGARILSALGVGGAVVGAAGVAVRSAGAIMRGATAWCRRNPAWCAQVGGTAAIAGMIQNGQLPMPRRRRGRGLSARDLRGFRKTTRLIRQTASSVGLGRGRSRGRSAGSAGPIIAQN